MKKKKESKLVDFDVELDEETINIVKKAAAIKGITIEEFMVEALTWAVENEKKIESVEEDNND